jgi:hypothetical protein
MTCLAIDSDLHDGTPKYGPPTFHDYLENIKGKSSNNKGSDSYKKVNEKKTPSNKLN